MGSSMEKVLEGEREGPVGKYHSVTGGLDSTWGRLGVIGSFQPEFTDVDANVVSRKSDGEPVSYPSELLPGSWCPRSRELLLMDVYSLKHLFQRALMTHTVP